MIIEQQVRANAVPLRRHESETLAACNGVLPATSAACMTEVAPPACSAAEAIDRQRRRSYRGGPLSFVGQPGMEPAASVAAAWDPYACPPPRCCTVTAEPEQSQVPLLSIGRMQQLQMQIELQRRKRENAFLLRD